VTLDSLKWTSSIGLVAIAFTWAYVLYLPTLDPEHSVENLQENAWSFQSPVYIGVYMGAYHCHYNSPKFFYELQNKGHWWRSVLVPFGSVYIVYWSFALAGVAAYGTSLLPDVLNNCNPDSLGAQVSFVGMALGIIFSYPIVMTATRNAIQDFVVRYNPSTANLDAAGMDAFLDRKRKPAAVLLVTTTSAIACYVKNIALVSAILGNTTVNCFTFIFPSLFYVCWQRQLKSGTANGDSNGDALLTKPKQGRNVAGDLLCLCCFGWGAVNMILGCYTDISKEMAR